MNIRDLLTKETIVADLLSTDKKGVLQELSQKIGVAIGVAPDYLARLLSDREQLGTTGIGHGIAIPHTKMQSITDVTIGAGISHTGVDFDAIDGKPVYIFFVLVVPEETGGAVHLELLAELSQILRSETVRKKLLAAGSADELIDIIANAEKHLE